MLGISSILKEPLGISYLEWQEIIFVANIIPVSFSMLEQQRIKRTRKKQGLLELKSSEINSEKRTLCFWKWMLQVKKFNSRLMFSRLDFWHCLFIDYLFFFLRHMTDHLSWQSETETHFFTPRTVKNSDISTHWYAFRIQQLDNQRKIFPEVQNAVTCRLSQSPILPSFKGRVSK